MLHIRLVAVQVYCGDQPVCRDGSAMLAARVVGAAGRLENRSVRAVASRLEIQPVVEFLPAIAADQSVEPGGPEKQASTAVHLQSHFLATA